MHASTSQRSDASFLALFSTSLHLHTSKLPAPWTTCVKNHLTKVVKMIAHVRIKQHSIHSYYLEATFEIRKQKYQIQVDHTTPEGRSSLFKLTILLNDCWLFHPKNIKKNISLAEFQGLRSWDALVSFKLIWPPLIGSTSPRSGRSVSASETW